MPGGAPKAVAPNERKKTVSVKVLVADDEKTVRDFFRLFLKTLSVEATIVEDGRQAVESAKKENFDLVFLDIRMPGLNGLQAFSELSKLNRGLACVFMTGYAEEKALVEEVNQPGTICLRKPFENINALKEIIERLKQQIEASPIRSKGETSEKRSFRRLKIDCEVSYRVTGRSDFLNASAKNISVGGVLLYLKEALDPGTVLDLVIMYGDHPHCTAAGEVVWCRQDEHSPNFYFMGVKFMEIDYARLMKLMKP